MPSMNDTDLLRRVEALEARLREVEDRAAILDLIARYGPAVDTCNGEAVRDLFADDGTYELEGWFFTHETMDQTVTTDLHERYVAVGSSHVMSLPTIELHGDEAVAINYSRVFIARDDQWIVDRCAANRWDLTRTPSGWKVKRRVNRLLQGTPASHELLAGEVPPPVR